MSDIVKSLSSLYDQGDLVIIPLGEEDGYRNIQIECEEIEPNPYFSKILPSVYRDNNGDAVISLLADAIEDGQLKLKGGD